MYITLYEDKYSAEMVEFVKKVWDKNYSLEKWKKELEDNTINNPYGKIGGYTASIAIDSNMIIGHVARKPCGFWLNGREIVGYFMVGIHVLPEYRGKGLAKSLPQKLIEDVPFITGFFVVKEAYKIWKHHGYVIPGKIPEYIKILQPKEILKKIKIDSFKFIPSSVKRLYNIFNKANIFPRFISLMLSSYNFILKRLFEYESKYSKEVVDDFNKGIDELWENNKQFIKYCQVRRADYLNWHFGSKEGWIKVICKRDSEVKGYAVLSLKIIREDKRVSDLKVMSIIDIFWDFTKPDICQELVSFSEYIARRENVDILICSINNSKAQMILRKKGFIRIPGTVYFSFYTAQKEIKEILSNKMKDWFMTRGDADAAGSLGPKS